MFSTHGSLHLHQTSQRDSSWNLDNVASDCKKVDPYLCLAKCDFHLPTTNKQRNKQNNKQTNKQKQKQQTNTHKKIKI